MPPSGGLGVQYHGAFLPLHEGAFGGPATLSGRSVPQNRRPPVQRLRRSAPRLRPVWERASLLQCSGGGSTGRGPGAPRGSAAPPPPKPLQNWGTVPRCRGRGTVHVWAHGNARVRPPCAVRWGGPGGAWAPRRPGLFGGCVPGARSPGVCVCDSARQGPARPASAVYFWRSGLPGRPTVCVGGGGGAMKGGCATGGHGGRGPCTSERPHTLAALCAPMAQAPDVPAIQWQSARDP